MIIGYNRYIWLYFTSFLPNYINMPQPLVVDLDGTLLRSDILLETVLGSVNGNLSLLFRMPFWMLKGKAYMKERLAKQAVVKEELLPYNRELVSFLEAERRHRPVVLATATHKIYAERIAAYLAACRTESMPMF